MLIFHGDNQLASRQAFLEIKNQAKASGQQIVGLDGSKITLPDLVSAAATVSLLGSNNVVFIENFFSRRPGNEKKNITNYLQSHPDSAIYLWESKDQSAHLRGIGQNFVKVYNLPKYVYQFLDNFSLNSLHLALRTTPAEHLLALLAGQIHKLILVRENAADLPTWQLAKLRSQAAKYPLDQLQQMNYHLLTIDYGQKTSALPYDLDAALELWVLSL